jgi:hypothetical protein
MRENAEDLDAEPTQPLIYQPLELAPPANLSQPPVCELPPPIGRARDAEPTRPLVRHVPSQRDPVWELGYQVASLVIDYVNGEDRL